MADVESSELLGQCGWHRHNFVGSRHRSTWIRLATMQLRSQQLSIHTVLEAERSIAVGGRSIGFGATHSGNFDCRDTPGTTTIKGQLRRQQEQLY